MKKHDEKNSTRQKKIEHFLPPYFLFDENEKNKETVTTWC